MVRTTFRNFASNITAEMETLNSQGEPGTGGSWDGVRCAGEGWELSPRYPCPPGGSLQNKVTSLKAEVENNKQELQAGERPSWSAGRGWGGSWWC